MLGSILAPKKQLEFVCNGTTLVAAYAAWNAGRLVTAATKPVVELALRAAGEIDRSKTAYFLEPGDQYDGQYSGAEYDPTIYGHLGEVSVRKQLELVLVEQPVKL